jgi:hypothetical protein
MLLDDGMSAAELAAMRAELEAYKVGGTVIALAVTVDCSSQDSRADTDCNMRMG